ncbi:MAG: hypothetical protein HQK54_17970, partial [Oligoflexales bacterium]|nr:hypothetical protein [Oligoflexales bacterium]
EMGVGFGGKGSCGWSLGELQARFPNVTNNFVALVTGNIEGTFQNRANCGRMIKVTMGGRCNGSCNGGQGSADQYTGATQNFIVADECPISNGQNPPCAANPHHLDLSRAALGNFTKNGSPMPLNDGIIWQRVVYWEFISN